MYKENRINTTRRKAIVGEREMDVRLIILAAQTEEL